MNVRRWLTPVAAVLGCGLLVLANEPATPSYEVIHLKKKLFQDEPLPEKQLQVGARPVAGSLLRTGSGAVADILCRRMRPSFAWDPKPEPGCPVKPRECCWCWRRDGSTPSSRS